MLANSAYAIQLLLHNSGTNTGSVGSSSGPSSSGTMSSSSSLRLFCSSLAMDKVERQLSIFFDEPERDHVRIIDWVLRQKCMVLHRFIFFKVPSLPAGKATVWLKECRPLLPEYWRDVMMTDWSGGCFRCPFRFRRFCEAQDQMGQYSGRHHCSASTVSGVDIHRLLGGSLLHS